VKVRHELARGNHQHAHRDQHGRQAEAESDDQKHAETDALQRHRAQQHDQGRRTGNDAAADAQGAQLLQRHRLIDLVTMMAVTAVPRVRPVSVIMFVRMIVAVATMIVSLRMIVGIGKQAVVAPITAHQQDQSKDRDRDARERAEPGIEPFRHDIT
jgi:hypothetical protein